MKTLKKTLCLVLAVVMVVGVLILPVGADYDDADKIEHEEAVAVLDGLKILQGKNDGTFDPTGKLTRAEAATMLARAVLTEAKSKVAAINDAGFTDVNDGDWYTPYVNWAYDEGYMGGNADGTFDPDGNITGYQFAKILLIAVGAATEKELSGVGYEQKVLNVNADVELDKNIDDLDWAAEITRDQAAQMTLDALLYTPETGETKYVVYGNDESEVLYSGTNMTLAMVAALSDKCADGLIHEQPDVSSSLGYKVYKLQPSATTDDFGRTCNSYTANGAALVTLDPLFDAEYTDEVKYNDLLKALGFGLKDEVDVTILVDGAKDETNSKKQSREKWNDETIGGAGVLVQARKTGIGTATIYVINTYAAVLTEENIQKADAEKELVDAVVFNQIENIAQGKIDLEYPTTAFKKDDVVLFTVSLKNEEAPKIVSMKLATKKAGVQVTASDVDSTYVRLDGGTDKVELAKNHVSDKNDLKGLVVSSTATYDVYLDDYGYIVNYATVVAGTPETPVKEYAYLIAYQESGWKAGSDANLYDDAVAATEAGARAKVLFFENGGKTSVIDLLVLEGDGNGNGDKGKFYLAKYDAGQFVPDSTKELQQAAASSNLAAKSIVSFMKSGDKYVLAAETDSDTTANEFAVDKNNAVITQKTSGTSSYANDDTVLTVITVNDEAKDDYTVVSYTGYKNFVKIATGEAQKALVETIGSTTKVARVAIAIVNAPEAPAAPDVYGVYVGEGERTTDGYAYKFLVDGVEKTYYSAAEIESLKGTTNVKKLYKVITGNDGKLTGTYSTEATYVVGNDSAKAVLLAASEYVVINESPAKMRNYAEGCVIYDVSGTTVKVITAADLAGIDLSKKDVEVKAMTVGGSGNNKDNITILIVTKNQNKA